MAGNTVGNQLVPRHAPYGGGVSLVGKEKIEKLEAPLIQAAIDQVAPLVARLTSLPVNTASLRIRTDVKPSEYSESVGVATLQRAGIPEPLARTLRQAYLKKTGLAAGAKVAPFTVDEETRTLYITPKAFKGKTVDTLKHHVFQALTSLAVHDSYPSYSLATDASMRDWATSRENFGDSAAATEKAFKSVIARNSLKTAYVRHWTAVADKNYFPAISSITGGLAANIKTLGSLGALSKFALRLARTESLMDQYYKTPNEVKGDMVSDMFSDARKLDAYLSCTTLFDVSLKELSWSFERRGAASRQ